MALSTKHLPWALFRNECHVTSHSRLVDKPRTWYIRTFAARIQLPHVLVYKKLIARKPFRNESYPSRPVSVDPTSSHQDAVSYPQSHRRPPDDTIFLRRSPSRAGSIINLSSGTGLLFLISVEHCLPRAREYCWDQKVIIKFPEK